MDSLADKEVSSIWQRVKRYIDVSEIEAQDTEGLAREIERKMNAAGEVSKKPGSMKTLVKKGFPQRAARVENIRDAIKGFQPAPPKPKPPKKRPKLPAKVKRRKGRKLAVKTKTRTRVYAAKFVKITRGRWRNKRAYWVYHTKKKKFLTWGLE